MMRLLCRPHLASVCLSRRHTTLTHQGAACDAASVHFGGTKVLSSMTVRKRLQSISIWQSTVPKVTIRTGFFGTVPISNYVSRKKSHFSPDAHLSPFWFGVPDLSRFARLCSRMLKHRWQKISSDFVCIHEQIAGGRGSAPDPAGELTTLLQAPKSDSRRIAPVALAPYDSRSSRTALPRIWSLNSAVFLIQWPLTDKRRYDTID